MAASFFPFARNSKTEGSTAGDDFLPVVITAWVRRRAPFTASEIAGGEFKVLASNQLENNYTLSSLAISGSRIFMRTSTHLYCIGRADQ